MNAKIKLSLFALASVAMLASCGESGTSLTRDQATAELDSYSKNVPAQTKLTYNDKTVKAGSKNSSAILDTTAVYGYRHFEVKTGNFEAGSTYYAYAKDGKYMMGAIVGSSKTYFEASETVVRTAITAAMTAATGYANYQAAGTSNWIKGLAKATNWIESNSKDKDDKETYGSGYAGGSVLGYVKSESYTKYGEGSMKADITAMYPKQDAMVTMGGEHCIYEWKNFQLTRLYNNFQDYEETLDWENASTNDMPIDANAWTKDATLVASVPVALATFAHAWSD